MSRSVVLVLNHFAVPAGEPGGTRHTELFGQLEGWDHVIVAARTNPSTRRRQANRPGFLFVPVIRYKRNGLARIASWVSYTVVVVVRTLVNRGRRPDLVYASSPHLLAGLAGAMISSRYRIPLILEVRDLWPKVLVDMGQLTDRSPVYRCLRYLEHWLYRRANGIVVLSEGVRHELMSGGVRPQQITVIPNAADVEFFKVDVPRQDARDRYGFRKFTFLYAGAHGPANALNLLLDAAAEVSGLDVEVVLVGDGVEKPQLMAAAAARGLSNVRFMDPVPKHQIPHLLHAADVGVHCLADVPLFRFGVSPNKVFDYMAAGKPVLTNTLGDVGEMVESAGSGMSVPPTGLGEGIKAMAFASESQRKSWSENGMSFIGNTHSRRAMARRLQLVLDAAGGEVSS